MTTRLTHLVVQGALQWLEDNQDKPLEEIQAAEASKADDDEEEDAETKAKIAELETGQARSLVCNECGKKFRNHDLATFHATKTYASLGPEISITRFIRADPCRVLTENIRTFQNQQTKLPP